MIRKRAMTTPGVDFMPGFTARKLLVSKSRISGALINGADGSQKEIQAKLVVGADGRQTRIAELAGLVAKVKPNGRFCYFAHYRNLPLQSAPRDRSSGHSNPTAMHRLFDSLPNAPPLEKAERVSAFMGMIEIPNNIRKVFKPGLALVGDAALAIDPLWGVGCGWAFQSAEWLAKAAGNSLQSPEKLDRGLAAYGRRHRFELAGMSS